jgi:hypothetical protein
MDILNVVQGSSITGRFVALDQGGNILNLSGFVVSGYSKYNYSSTGYLLNLNPSIHTSYINGWVDISLDGTGTATLPVGQFPFTIEVYSGNYIRKCANGYMYVEPEVS